MRALVGRDTEMARLESYYRADYPRTLAVYGRRRVGKTALVRAFCENKPHIMFDLTGTSRGRIMDSVSESVAGFTGEDPLETRRRMTDISDLFGFLGNLEPDEKLIVFLDELPDAVAAFDDVPAMLKRYIDGRLEEQNILLIVCGSSVSGMMSEINDDSRPLFGRFPVQMAVRPLPYREARRFHPGLPEDERMRMYAIASGIPMYHLLLSQPTAAEGIRELFLGPVAGLRNETAAFLSREFTNWTAHERILEAISDGATTLKTVSDATGMSKTYCADLLRRLEVAEVVQKRVPYGMKDKSATYRISDGMLAFHYAVLSRAGEAAESEDVEWAFERVRARVDEFYGHRFEDICAQYVRDTRHCTWTGFWEGRVPLLDEDGTMDRDDGGRVVTVGADLDIVAKVDLGEYVATLVGECKFTRGRSGRRELEELIRRTAVAIKDDDNLRYIMFSRSGFTEELEELAEDGRDVRLELVTPDDMGALYDATPKQDINSRCPSSVRAALSRANGDVPSNR